MLEFKSLTQLLDHFPNEEACIEYYEHIRWGGNPACPHCGSINPYKTKIGWKCSDNTCYKKFTVKVGTIFESSKIKMRIWFAAIFLVSTSKKGVSSVQLASQLGLTQKTAWFMLHRIREVLKQVSPNSLGGDNIVETDECYVGGLEANKHKKKKRSNLNPDLTNEGKPYKPKKVVIGIIERGGKVVLRYIPSSDRKHLENTVVDYVKYGSKIYSDEFWGYNELKYAYNHSTVNHSLKVYVRGDVHTNTIENFWSGLKRGLYGIYHQVSDKHMSRYLNEFASRFNSRTLPNNFKFELFLKDSENRLSYKELIG